MVVTNARRHENAAATTAAPVKYGVSGEPAISYEMPSARCLLGLGYVDQFVEVEHSSYDDLRSMRLA
jgi:hypothetical protein